MVFRPVFVCLVKGTLIYGGTGNDVAVVSPGTAKIVSLRARGYVRSFFLEYTKAEVDALVHAAKRLVLATMYGG